MVLSMNTRHLLSLSLFCSFFACGGEDDPMDGNDPLPIEYYQGDLSAELGTATNRADCATCHSNDGTVRSGNTFRDIAYHSSFKGGDEITLLGAANQCVTGWMGGQALTANDPRWLKLEEYLQSISTQTATVPNVIAPEVLQNLAAYEEQYSTGGDAEAGAAKYTQTCGGCHDSNKNIGGVPAPAKVTIAADSVGVIAQQVRTSGPPPSSLEDVNDTRPGPMPFFEPSDLSITDLRDIIAHLKAQ